MPTANEYREALRRMPLDAPCEDANGYKLPTVRDVLAQIGKGGNQPVPHLPRLREDGVVVC